MMLPSTETEILQNRHKAIKTFENILHNFFILVELSKSNEGSRDLKFTSHILRGFFSILHWEAFFKCRVRDRITYLGFQEFDWNLDLFENAELRGNYSGTAIWYPPLTLSLSIVSYLFYRFSTTIITPSLSPSTM